ncbi:hypothetical protein DVK85_03275 [Flavobacterium arcticum]|uniref:Uncharacterized protein n=1 Tax=Flavobacterium arcticum TaxID=1784713 RepID=A0A345H9P1_9FLAO|nr:hypothetical protein [Flavobacterium arcticum]AXG73301.1 hypothetical protein DVK85_03275 [Flavobacterium arcticum]KAF2513096.1 hypothetical protein E0W72_01340 [Flavobacterium arcticum]
MDTKEDLIRKRHELLKRAELISLVLQAEYGEVVDSKPNVIFDSSINGVFPMKGGTVKQILWLFENVFSKSVKLKEVVEKLEEYKGENIKIDNLVRRMRTDKKLVMVKYENKQILSWWGKPEWINGNDFDKEYKSDDAPETDIKEVVGS